MQRRGKQRKYGNALVYKLLSTILEANQLDKNWIKFNDLMGKSDLVLILSPKNHWEAYIPFLKCIIFIYLLEIKNHFNYRVTHSKIIICILTQINFVLRISGISTIPNLHSSPSMKLKKLLAGFQLVTILIWNSK